MSSEPLSFNWLCHLSIYVTPFKWSSGGGLSVGADWIQPCGHAAARFTKLYIKRLLDNLIPLGDMVKSFLCQFSPSLLFKPLLSSCSPTMQDCALFFSCSLISFLCMAATPQTPQTACSLCKWSAFHAQSWMRPQQNLSLVLLGTHTHTHTLSD